ncbi:uncharacterized protein LOC119742931 isoform X2 [Patiria miniata]|uniref:Uncharacterized protein n=1 Tax=Patiria miniata TaxID=46514 RepID=A0A914BFU5_PATMI|nr:uncharacterized protein LOC119742931 isoform X2 [Patiria miniata]
MDFTHSSCWAWQTINNSRDVNQIFTTYTDPAPNSASLVTHLIVPQSQQPSETDTSSLGYEQTDGQQSQIEYQYACINDPSQSTANGEVVLIEIPDEGSKGDLEDETCYTEHNLLLLLQEKEHLEKTLEEVRTTWAQTEHRMKGTIERLRTKVEYLSNTNTSLKQQLSMMHTSSLKCLTNDSENQSILQELLNTSEEHTQLLHHHLAQLWLYAQACPLSKPTPEESAAESTVLVPDLTDQSQDISHMAMMSSSEGTLGNMEQTVVMTITSEEDSEPLVNIVDNPGDTVGHDSLTLD